MCRSGDRLFGVSHETHYSVNYSIRFPAKHPFFLSHFQFFFSSPSHSPFKAFSKLRLCCMCAAFPYLLVFSLWQTCSPSLTAYRGIAGEYQNMVSFRPFNEVVLVPRPASYIWSGHVPSGFQTRLGLFSIVKVRIESHTLLSTLYSTINSFPLGSIIY